MMDKQLQQMEALLREKDSLNARVQQLSEDKSSLASDMDYFHWLENKEVKNIGQHGKKITMEKERPSIKQQMIEREEKVLIRDLEHLSLKEEWFMEKEEKEQQDPPKEQPHIENMLKEMEEMRRSFQAEKDTISKKREAFEKEMVGKCMMRKACNTERENMEQEREDFQTEKGEMGMRRKAYLKEKLGIERMIFNSVYASGDTNGNCNEGGKNMKYWTQKRLSCENPEQNTISQDNNMNPYWPESVWMCKNRQGNCGCRRR